MVTAHHALFGAAEMVRIFQC